LKKISFLVYWDIYVPLQSLILHLEEIMREKPSSREESHDNKLLNVSAPLPNKDVPISVAMFEPDKLFNNLSIAQRDSIINYIITNPETQDLILNNIIANPEAMDRLYRFLIDYNNAHALIPGKVEFWQLLRKVTVYKESDFYDYDGTDWFD